MFLLILLLVTSFYQVLEKCCRRNMHDGKHQGVAEEYPDHEKREVFAVRTESENSRCSESTKKLIGR